MDDNAVARYRGVGREFNKGKAVCADSQLAVASDCLEGLPRVVAQVHVGEGDQDSADSTKSALAIIARYQYQQPLIVACIAKILAAMRVAADGNDEMMYGQDAVSGISSGSSSSHRVPGDRVQGPMARQDENQARPTVSRASDGSHCLVGL